MSGKEQAEADPDGRSKGSAFEVAEMSKMDAAFAADAWGTHKKQPPTAAMKHRCDDHLEDIVGPPPSPPTHTHPTHTHNPPSGVSFCLEGGWQIGHISDRITGTDELPVCQHIRGQEERLERHQGVR